MLCGILDELAENSYVPILASGWGGDGSVGEREHIQTLIDRRVDGVVLFPSDDEVPNEHLREVWEQNIPVVTVDREMERTDADFVGSDDEAGATDAAEYLLGLGHRHVAHLAGPQYVTTARLRRRWFELAIEEGGGSCVTEEAEGFRDGYGPATAALCRTPRPTALFCVCDLMLPGVYDVAAKMRLHIPDDLSVLGFSGHSLTQGLRPHATTVQQFPYEIGRRAVQLVVERIESDGEHHEPRHFRLKTELVVRGSTGRPPIGD